MAEGRATVFVSNIVADHDYGPLTKYGVMRPITSGNYPIYKTARLLEEIATAIADSVVTDYLAFSGSSFVAGVCLAAWLLKHEECNVLLYDKRQTGYIPRIIKRSEVRLLLEQAADRRTERK